MRAAVLTGLREVELQDRPEPRVRPGWVMVQVEAAALCGTDVHQYDGRIDTPFPRVPGHDFSGRVVALGESLERSQQDVAVAVKPSLPCDRCAECMSDRLSTTSRTSSPGSGPTAAAPERIAVPVVNLVALPEGIEARQAALLEPLAVGLNTVDRLRLVLGQSVVVLGQGPSGLPHAAVRAVGCRPPHRHRCARGALRGVPGLGGSDCLDVTQLDAVERVLALTVGRGPTP